MNWEILAEGRHAVVRRNGRFIAVDLLVPHHTISTSARNGGQTDHLRYLITAVRLSEDHIRNFHSYSTS
jgi:hypothetical protein